MMIARGEKPAEEEEEDEPVADGDNKKRKAGGSSKSKANKKKKGEAPAAVAPPPRLPQSALISGGTLKGYQLDGMNWIIERYLYALFGAIVSDSSTFFLIPISFFEFCRFSSSPTKWVPERRSKPSPSSHSSTRTFTTPPCPRQIVLL